MPATVSSSSSFSHRRGSFYGRARTSSSVSSSSSASTSSGTEADISFGANTTAESTSSFARSSSSTSSLSKSRQQARMSPAKQQQQHAAVTSAAAKRSATKQSEKRKMAASTSTSTLQSIDSLRGTGVRSIIEEPEYEEDIIAHMHHMETETVACVELMDAQPELRWFMRPYLVDFIVEIHQTFRLRPETLFLTMNIVDRYVSKRIVYKRHYQLVGCAALLIASKFEDAKDRVPTVTELAQMCCNAYEESAFTQMEGHVLSTIGWVLGFPTPEAWLRLSFLHQPQDQKTMSVARFLVEATLFQRDFIGVVPSQLADGALFLARCICDPQSAAIDSTTAEKETVDAAKLIDNHLAEHASELSNILVKKYSFSHFSQASLHVRDHYVNSPSDRRATVLAAMTGLLPAQSVSATNLAEHQQQTSSFSTPRRSSDVDDDEDDVSMRSRCTSPSSMISTPSRMSADEDGDYDEEDEEEEEEEEDRDMPVTPLSLTALHDPLVAASSKVQSGRPSNVPSTTATQQAASTGKENMTSVSITVPQLKVNGVTTERQALTSTKWDGNARMAA